MSAEEQPFFQELGDDGGGRRHGVRPVDWAFFILRSALRHRVLAVAVWAAGSVALVGYYAGKTPLYRVETTILAQRQQALPSLARTNAVEDSPTRASTELILRRENLISLIQDANLLDPSTSTATRKALTGDAMDRVLSGNRNIPPSTDPIDQFVFLLDRNLKVITGEATITIRIDWPEPRQAFRIVEGALQNFLESRHLQEVTAMDEVISLLQGRAATARAELSKVVEEARRSAVLEAGRASLPAAAAPARAARGAPMSAELARLRSLLEAKERAIGDVEEFRRRRLADLQAQYDARRAVYSDRHPEIATLRQDIAALSRDSPQIAGLRDEERKLRQEYEAQLAREVTAPSPVALAAAPVRSGPEGVGAAIDGNERVRDARFRYQQMLDRVNGAQVELDTARAAFKYRYAVVWPAQMPTRPVSPNPRKIFGLGGLAALILGFLAAAAADLRAGRVVERWQVERGLGLPIVAEIREK